jgi:hypothetical protein
VRDATLPASPTVRLRQILAAARAQGLSFEAAWYPALARAVMPYPERHAWLEVFADNAVRETFRRCYEREEPTPLDAALVVAAEDVVAIGAFPAWEVCELEGCEKPVVKADRRAQRKRYCCEAHLRQAMRERERERGPRQPLADVTVNGSPAAAERAPRALPPSSASIDRPKEAIS